MDLTALCCFVFRQACQREVLESYEPSWPPVITYKGSNACGSIGSGCDKEVDVYGAIGHSIRMGEKKKKSNSWSWILFVCSLARILWEPVASVSGWASIKAAERYQRKDRLQSEKHPASRLILREIVVFLPENDLGHLKAGERGRRGTHDIDVL